MSCTSTFYQTMKVIAISVLLQDSVYKPTTPDPMYVTCMPWSAFPYGIPIPAKPRISPMAAIVAVPESQQETELFALATPTPRMLKKTMNVKECLCKT